MIKRHQYFNTMQYLQNSKRVDCKTQISTSEIPLGAIMELEEKLNEVRSSHGHQIDDILINQGQIRKVRLTGNLFADIY